MTNRVLKHHAFNMEAGRFKPVPIGDRNWLVYDNANFSVHITDRCNADCQFCIAHLRYADENMEYVKAKLDSTAVYLQGLEDALRLVKGVNPSVSITGGEPTVNRRFSGILDVIKKVGTHKLTCTTNGTGFKLRVPNSQDTVLDRILDSGMAHLNLSRSHYLEAENNRIMRMPKYSPRDCEVKEYIKALRDRGIRVRLSCILLKEGIHSLDNMLRYLDWAESIGVDNVIFRQLMAFSNSALGTIPIYCNEQNVELEPLWTAMDQSGLFQVYHSVVGYYYYVEIRKYKHMDVVTEAADLNAISSQLDKYTAQLGQPCAFELVYHPNGDLCAGWIDSQRIMKEF